MVRTGARASVLCDTLVATGLKAVAAPSTPRLADLPAATAAELLGLYRLLGGLQESPTLRPGGWDLAFEGGLVVELDEELHFNRYRAATLAASWAADRPWKDDYVRFCSQREADCLDAGSWGKRWTNDSAARMFSGGPPRDLNGYGAPRWKQRALYDAMKDAAPLLPGGIRLARVATYDTVDGRTLGHVLDQRATADPAAIRALLEARIA